MKKRFRIKRAFSVILVSYAVILMIPVAMAAGFSEAAARLSFQKCVDDTLYDIRQGKAVLEKSIEDMDSRAMYLTYDYSLRWILQLGELLPGDTNVIALKEFQKRLSDIFSDTSVFGQYSVLLKNEYVFNNSTMIQGRKFYYENYRNYAEMTYDDYLQGSFYSRGRSIFPMQTIRENRKEIRGMTYNCSIVNSTRKSGEADAAIQFVIQESELKKIFQPIMSQDGSRIYISDAEGRQLASLSQFPEAGEGSMDWKGLKESAGYEKIRSADGTGSILIYDKSGKYGLTYGALIPEKIVFKNFKQVQWMSLIMMGIAMIVEAALGVCFAWKYSTPIRNLVQNLQMMVGENDWKKNGNSEFEYLESGVHRILKANESMQLTLREKEQKNFLNYLLSGEFKESEDIVREGALAGFCFGDMKYCAVSLLMDNAGQYTKVLEKMNWESVLAIFCMDKSGIAILFGFKGEEPRILDQAEAAGAFLRRETGREVWVGQGKSCENESDIVFSYRQSVFSASFARREKREDAVCYEIVSQYFGALFYPTELEEKLINSAKQGNERQIGDVFSCIREENLDKRYLAKSMSKVLVYNIMATLMKLYNDLSPGEQVDRVVEEIGHRENLSEALELLEQQFVYIGGQMNRSRGSREEKYREKLEAYLEANYGNPQMCVVMAAEKFTLSENYFSQFFKEVMKDSFSSCLERIRMKKARELLDTGMYDVEKIAEMTGYNNSGTFRRAFRRVNGISPSSWKNRSK